MSIIFEICSLNLILFSFAHSEILFISTLEIFSDFLMDSALIIITKLPANAIVFVRLVYLRFKRGLYCMFQHPGPQHDHCEEPVVNFFSSV